uniref:Valitocin n=1 Tax=Squalus acanthias TaxID=7797 RepID=OXYV_SQUAC|nr:RecName: Full=Valitocin [Squalus acanthias]prf//720633B valitocin [Squalus acanthias]
CYIQNCPVG